MLHGNLQAQIRYAMIKGLAESLDEKAQLLIEAESNFEPQADESFVEIAMPEIESMAQAVIEPWIDLSKHAFWEPVRLSGRNTRMKMGEPSECPIPVHWKNQRRETDCWLTLKKSTFGWRKYIICMRKGNGLGFTPWLSGGWTARV